jgi:hypothetical protein
MLEFGRLSAVGAATDRQQQDAQPKRSPMLSGANSSARTPCARPFSAVAP